MSSGFDSWGPSQGYNIDHSHHETFYGSYINQGYHASEGGIMNFNYQFSLSNPVEDHGAAFNQLFDSSAPSHTYERSLPKRRLTNSGASADPSQSKRQRVGDFVKITLDIAKESADFGNPLKAALAGVSALVEHYEEFEGVKNKIHGLQSQLGRLKQNITTSTIDGDPEETTRHTELISVLGEIEKRSQELLQNGRATQFVDKGRDSGDVAKLVDQFQDAITHYRISQQQAIYERITDLTVSVFRFVFLQVVLMIGPIIESSFYILFAFQENSLAVKNKLDYVMGRLDQLCPAEDTDDDNNHERWAKLFNTLRLIGDNGNVLYNRINAEGYQECEDDIQAASGIAEDIRDALLDYQISQQRAIYDQNCKLIDPMDLAVLNNCRRARGAAYQHGNRRGCLRGTREAVLNEIESWTKDFNESPVFWLNGLAGTGKSTIAQTFAEHAFADGLLGASFFCSRDFEDRSDLRFIFPTLAFQLAHQFSSFRDLLVPLLRSNPDIVDESLCSQMERLIVEPLRTAEISTVIVVDALDECKDDEPSSALLSVLGRFVKQIPRVKFFITGRPEPRIKTGFRLPLLEDATNVFVLHDVHPDLINNDIRLFLKHELSELAQRRRLEGWPSDEHISLLCQRAAGLFIYAVATVKFLDGKNHLPERRLDVIVRLPECTIPEGKTQFKPRTTLDSLYMSVLEMAFSEEDPEVDSKVQSIIGAVVLLVNPLPPSGIAELTNLNPREVDLLLTSVQSLLIFDEDPTQPVKSFHKSFPDFVTDPSRCVDTRFYISPEHVHLQLTVNCLKVLSDGLEQNFLNLPDYSLNSEVEDLQTRIDGRISAALRYACQSWHNHLSMSQGDFTDVISRLRFFLEEKFLAWLEVLSVLKATKAAVVALEKLMSWLQEVSMDDQLLDTARDCFYFVTEFFEPINVSATHIYHSALELCPLSSIVRKLHYHRRLTPLPNVQIGIPDSRDPTIVISSKGHATWSPCGHFVATLTPEALEIRDALTFELVSTLLQCSAQFIYHNQPSYSPDGNSIACYTLNGITIWDIQTGGVVKKFEGHSVGQSLVWSSDGGVVCVLYDRSVIICDVASGGTRLVCSFTHESGNEHLWAHNGSFRVLTSTRNDTNTTIHIIDVWPIPTKIESFSIQLVGALSGLCISPATYRISGSIQSPARLLILDIRNLETLLDDKGQFHLHCFSSDGSRFAALRSRSLHIWNYDGERYTSWRQFPIQDDILRIRFSPTSSSILVCFSRTLQLWRLDSPNAALTPQLNILSRSGTRIATAHYRGKTITITNLSQSPSQFIDTDFKIAGLGLTGNVLLARGVGVAVAWLLTEEGWVSNISGNRRASRGDSIWTMSLSPHFQPTFSVEGETGAIQSGGTFHIYNSRTGEVLEPTQEPPRLSGPWYSFKDNMHAQDTCCNSSVQHSPPKGNWEPSKTTFAEEWLEDPQGKRLLWLPIDWRLDQRSDREVEWFPDMLTIKFYLRDDKPVIIKLYELESAEHIGFT